MAARAPSDDAVRKERSDASDGRMPRADVAPLRIPGPDGAVIAAELIGSPDHPLVLLVAGGESSMDWWRPAFCDLLVARGLRVARYDQRGMGETTLGPPGTRRDGTSDPMFPIGNGEALARDIPRSRLVPVPGGGHERPPSAWAFVVEAIAGA